MAFKPMLFLSTFLFTFTTRDTYAEILAPPPVHMPVKALPPPPPAPVNHPPPPYIVKPPSPPPAVEPHFPPPPPYVVKPPSPPPAVKPPSSPPPLVKPPVAAPPKPITKADCSPLCDRRCQLHSRQGLCMRACMSCCDRCKCVPPGTYGNKEKCGKCYTDMTTHGHKLKCP